VPRQVELTDAIALRPVHVAAGILQDASGRVLITERLGGSQFAGLWEFPGGKIAQDESATSALARELYEELGIEVRVFEHFMSVVHHYADRNVAIEFYLVTGWQSVPVGLDGQALRWIAPELLNAEDMLPADVPVLEALRALPAVIRKR
jgi:8-oxo-dGTP diphosphatase